MISYDLDPSLHNSEPEPPVLGDGFSRRQHGEHAEPVEVDAPPVLPEKGDF